MTWRNVDDEVRDSSFRYRLQVATDRVDVDAIHQLSAGSRTGQACIMNAFKLRLAFSVFTGSSWNLGSFQEPFEVLEFFIAESLVVNCGFIVYSMGQSDLFGLRRETLQQRLNSPGFMLARGFPKQRGRLFGIALLNQRGIETFLE